jgi:hypothetical protein
MRFIVLPFRREFVMEEQPQRKNEARFIDSWKWWYYVILGVLIAAMGVYHLYEGRMSKSIGSFLVAAMLIAFGIFSKAADGKGQP